MSRVLDDELTEAAHFLRDRDIEEAWAEAHILLAGALGIDRARLPAVDDVPDVARERFREFVRRRGETREPVAYILGRCEFYGLTFRTTPAALIPRPATETLVERALALRPGTALDVGTGSGAIAVVLAKHGVRVTATEMSDAALDLARENAASHGATIEFRKADLFVDGDFDLIVSNPPYVKSAEVDDQAPDLRHEPRLAFDGGPDGLREIRRLLAPARGPILIEVGAGQPPAVTDLALRAGFRDVRWWKDLLGIDRVLEAR